MKKKIIVSLLIIIPIAIMGISFYIIKQKKEALALKEQQEELERQEEFEQQELFNYLKEEVNKVCNTMIDEQMFKHGRGYQGKPQEISSMLTVEVSRRENIHLALARRGGVRNFFVFCAVREVIMDGKRNFLPMDINNYITSYSSLDYESDYAELEHIEGNQYQVSVHGKRTRFHVDRRDIILDDFFLERKSEKSLAASQAHLKPEGNNLIDKDIFKLNEQIVEFALAQKEEDWYEKSSYSKYSFIRMLDEMREFPIPVDSIEIVTYRHRMNQLDNKYWYYLDKEKHLAYNNPNVAKINNPHCEVVILWDRIDHPKDSMHVELTELFVFKSGDVAFKELLTYREVYDTQNRRRMSAGRALQQIDEYGEMKVVKMDDNDNIVSTIYYKVERDKYGESQLVSREESINEEIVNTN